MASREPTSVEHQLINSVLQLKEALRLTSEGEALCRQIESGNLERDTIQSFIDRSFLVFLRTLLQKYIKNSKSDPTTRVKVILIQQRLLSLLAKYKKHRMLPSVKSRHEPAETKDVALDHTFEQHIVSMLWAASAVSNRNNGGVATLPERDNGNKRTQSESSLVTTKDSVFDINFDRSRKEIGGFLETLDKRLSDTISHNIDFVAHLKTVQWALQKTNNVDDTATLRQILIDAAEELILGHEWLSDNLQSAEDCIDAIKTRTRRLHEDVIKVRQHTLTDEFTGMPNRIAFVRRLNAEIARARRHGYPLTVAIIDPDQFSEIYNMVGPSAGDAVLRCYAEKVLSKFRLSDVVARFSDYGFALLLPNTEKEQALCALRKAQMRAAESYYHYDGRKRSMPTFSTGLTRYAPGETPASLLARADKALLRAKGKGRNRIEIELPQSQSVDLT